jgi:hypothetical protein
VTIDGQREILSAQMLTIHGLAYTAWIFYFNDPQGGGHFTLRSLLEQGSESYKSEIALVP